MSYRRRERSRVLFLSCWVVVVIVVEEMKKGCSSTMIEVGGEKGWVVGAVNYSEWSQANHFLPGDSLVFSYYEQYHNVLEVDKAAYETCNVTTPLASYDDGSTVVTLNKTGHYYFLCGILGHCTSGQKLHVFVTNDSLVSPIPSPSPSPRPSPSSNVIGANHTISSPSLAPSSSTTTTLAYCSSLCTLALLSILLPLFTSIFFSPQHTVYAV